MTTHDTRILADRKKALEEEFFARHERELVERVRLEAQEKERKEGLAEASGIRNEEVLDRLVALGVDAGAVSVLGLVPLVEVAWADRELHDREREAVMQAAGEAGAGLGTAAHDLLVSWLDKRPGPDLLQAWKGYVAALIESLDQDERQALRDGILHRAQGVAAAAGGFLGVGKISDVEQRKLDELAAAFD
jgi:hypothetical protein